MENSIIINAIMFLGGLGAFMALILSIASRVFHVEVDPRVTEVLKCLPGSNCGACGGGGCHDFAEKVVKGEMPTNGCIPGGGKVACRLAKVMGIKEVEFINKRAVVHCGAKESQRKMRADYQGIKKCREADLAAGGPLECTYGCLGFGDCFDSCLFDAITMVEGLPKVNLKKCTGCGKCITACPRNIISLKTYEENKPLYAVTCSSHDKGPVTRKACPVGCIACKICEKNAPEVFVVSDLLARVEYEKANAQTNWNLCLEKCPTKCIVKLN